MEINTDSPEATQKAGHELSASLKPGSIVALTGELGAGKTTFVKGIAEGLGISSRITSPTFIIMRSYDNNFYHVDLYRLDDNIDQEVANLGLLDIIKEGNSIVVIEWAEKIRNLLPENTIWINFKILEENKRK